MRGRLVGFTNVFHTEDELRKQADTFMGKVKVRGVTFSPPRTRKLVVLFFFFGRIWPTVCSSGRHHRPGGPPSTDKRLGEDLYKKVMSGDPVAARLPPP